MPLDAGTRLGAYEVVSPLGAGGMGEVYRARDTKIGRDVALKILPESFVHDPERVSRFQREAQVLGALNHPHIAAIYGLEESGAQQFLVLELVDGETLDARLKPRAIPVDEALAIARQIADALQAAHDKGIVHRDLKPANIALNRDGQVKVLDFGVAKFSAGEAGDASGGLTHSPTLTFAATQAGMILGTAAYMSPEQAKGRAADKRTDVWAFGCVLFEMLAGKRAFQGEDITDVITSIMRDEPDWQALPQDLPTAVRTLIQRCLHKNRQQRIADIAVAQFLLNEPGEAATRATRAADALRPSGPATIWKSATIGLAVMAIAAAGAATFLYLRTPAKLTTRFFVQPPEKGVFVTAGRTGASAVISPDGSRLAFTSRDESGKILIWIRPIDSLGAHPLPGTDGAEFPFWSPDSRSLGYFANSRLLRIDAAGGPPQAICTADGARGGTWGPNGVIVFGGGSISGLSRVAASGGQANAITKADVGDHRFPSFLPDGRHVLFHMNSLGLPDKMGLYVTTIDPGPIKRLAAAQTAGVYAAPGFLLFVRQSTLIAQRFDLKALELTGEPTPVAERAESGVFSGVLAFSVSDTGTLAYGIGAGREENTQLTWFDRQGKRLEPLGQPVTYTGVDLSPDQKRVVAHRHDAGAGGDLWMIDVERGTTSRFTFDATQDNSSPVWSPDGSRVAYGSLRNGGWGLFAKASNGTAAEEVIGQPAPVVGPRSWSPDGRFLVYAVSNASTGSDVWSLPLAGDRKPVPLLTTRFQERNPQLSPDGKWLAYSSDETGVPELYVRPFPAGDGKWQISTAGGWEPRWRGDSRELFYADRAQQGAIMSVDITGTGSAFSFSSPRKLFDMVALTSAHPGSSAMRYAVTRDGQRFLIPVIPRAATFSDATSPPIAVVVNWAAALGK